MKILFFDIDGTLAIGQDVPKSASEVIAQARQQGDIVFICTGRPLGYVKNHFKNYGDGFIASNGRYAIYQDQVIYNRPITNKQVSLIRDKLNQLSCSYAFFDQNEGYFYGLENHYNEMKKVWPKGFLHYGLQDKRYYSFDILFNDQEHFSKIKKELPEVLFNPHGSHPSADATVLGEDKGKSVEYITEYFHVDKDQTYAFGDSLNDISMLKAVGHSVAMGNALEQVKQEAEYITTDILDNGIKNAFLHYKII